jgi:transposase
LSTRCGISAKQLEREIGCNYKTALRMFHVIRDELMDEGEFPPLSGEVEVDETYVGAKLRRGSPRGRPGPDHPSKTAVFGAVSRSGRVVASVIPDARALTLRASISRFVEPGSVVYTDEYQPYRRVWQDGYVHYSINHSQGVYVAGNVHTQTVEGFFSLVKNAVRGVYHGVSRRWLQGYLNKYSWRWNHREDARPMFDSLLLSAASKTR